MPILIVGLGNPGENYQNTRHNTGRIILEFIKKKYDFSEWKKDLKNNSLTYKGEIAGESVVLVEPETYMNKSGTALKNLITSEKKAEKMIVIYDDLDLPFGTMKMSFNRGSGGHRGVESIIKAIKTEKFIRIRVGIAPTTQSGKMKKPSGAVAVEKCIMGEFKKPETQVLKKLSKNINKSLETFVTYGLARTMSEFNQ